MCIICVCPAGVPLPDKATRKRMWDKNRDGAGYMTIKNGSLEVRKGFMAFESFEEFVENLDPSQPRVLHYRIGTNGANTPENTHPWKVTDDEAICHNGIISWLADDKNVSDSKRLADMIGSTQGRPCSDTMRMDDPIFRGAIERAIGSYNKVVYLNGYGDLRFLNESSGIWDNGVWYSNHGYKEYTAPSVCDPRTATWPKIEYDLSAINLLEPIMRTAKYVPHYDTVMLTDTDGTLYDMDLQEFIANKDDFNYTPSLAKKIDKLVDDWHKIAKRHKDKLTF